MNEDRNQDRFPRQQARQQHPDEWQRDLNPDHMAGQNIGSAEPGIDDASRRTAFHLRKQGQTLRELDDSDLKQVPILRPGTRLQQGATYINLADAQPREFTASGGQTAGPDDAFAPKDEVPYQVWNRLRGGQS